MLQFEATSREDDRHLETGPRLGDGTSYTLRTSGCPHKTVIYEARRSVFFEGDPVTHVFEVLAGLVRLYRLMPDGRRQVTRFCGPGHLVGFALDPCHGQAADAVTLTRLCLYPMPCLRQRSSRDRRLGRYLFRAISSELRAAWDQILLLGRKTAMERLASFLIMLAELDKDQPADHDTLHLPMTRADIGDFLGLTTETVSRLIHALQKLGVIELRGHHAVVLTDKEALSRLAEDAEESRRMWRDLRPGGTAAEARRARCE